MISDERLEELARSQDETVKVAAIELLSRRRLSRLPDDEPCDACGCEDGMRPYIDGGRVICAKCGGTGRSSRMSDGNSEAIEALAAIWSRGYVAGTKAEARASASVYESREAWAKRAEELKEALLHAIVFIESKGHECPNLRTVHEGK